MTRDEIFGNGFLRLNKTLSSALGLEKAAVLSYINEQIECSEIIRQYMKDNDGFFFISLDALEGLFGMSSFRQKKLFDELVADGLIEVRYAGTHGRRHVRLNEVELTAVINSQLNKKAVKKAAKVATIQSRDDFYSNLNAAINGGFETFKAARENIEASIAMQLYVFTKLLKLYHGIDFSWTSQRYGQFKAIINPYKNKECDYTRFAEIMKNDSFKHNDYIINNFKELNRSIAEHDPSLRVFNPQLMDWWKEIA